MTPGPEIRLLALDVDGTLAARGDEVTPATREALHRATDAGVLVVIATGRRYRTTMRVVEALGLPVHAVCLGGALVKAGDGRTLHSERFRGDDFANIHRLARQVGQAAIFHRDSSSGGGPDFVIDTEVDWNEQTRSYYDQNDAWGARGGGFGPEACPDAVTIGTFGPEVALRALRAEVEGAHPGAFGPSLVPSHGDGAWYLELTPRDVSKWSGLCALAAHTGIATEAICAVGDQVNDLPMLRRAGMSVAMGNAVEDVKDAAHWVTGACDEDGIVAVVDRILSS